MRNNWSVIVFKQQKLTQMALNINHLDVFLGEGAFSWVYSIKKHPYAAKISKSYEKDFQNEFRLLHQLHNHNQQLFPKVINTGILHNEQQQSTSSSNRNYLLMERLGASLQELIQLRKTLSLSTIMHIGKQILAQLSILVTHGIVHNDIKPANLLFGLAQRRKQVFLVDYGFSATSSFSNCHVFCGNLAFSASRKLRGVYTHDVRNDLQSFIYVMLWMLRDGDLPWQQKQSNEGLIGRRAIEILLKRQQFIASTLQSQKQYTDQRLCLIYRLVCLLSANNVSLGECLCVLQA